MLLPFALLRLSCRFSGRKPNRHWNMKFAKLRAEKFIAVDLPNFDEMRKHPSELTPEEMRTQLKKMGMPPTRTWRERPLHISCSMDFFEPYVPTENEERTSLLSKIKDESLKKVLFKQSLAENKITKYDKNWTAAQFAEETAKEIYINAHKALMERNTEMLHELVTERAYPQMFNELKLRSIRWNWVETLEKPKTVHMRVNSMIAKDNLFAQVTVRLHSKQILAVYDQFGRLMFGDELVPRDVLEYVVYEKHLADLYGRWRLHGKIPLQSSQKQPVLKTFKLTEDKELYEGVDDVKLDRIIPDEDEKALTSNEARKRQGGDGDRKLAI